MFLLGHQVNNVDFTNIIREEAVLFLLDLPKGEEVTILAQKKKDGESAAFGGLGRVAGQTTEAFILLFFFYLS